jgi:hypothetical protein
LPIAAGGDEQQIGGDDRPVAERHRDAAPSTSTERTSALP